MTTYTGATGSTYNLAGQLGAGGEGIVYAIQGSNDKVAKLYKPEKIQDRDAQEQKLRIMLQMNIPAKVDGILRLAWPLDILYSQGQMVGFVMPKISKMLKIFDIQRCWRADSKNSGTQKTLAAYPNYTWKYAVQFAYNLAWVVKYVHSYGIIIGDLNQNNIYADTDTGAVVLIDCDSFDITDKQTGERFPCEVGLGEILAPELQTVGKLKGKFTKNTDNFSLAIHIFRLLMRNADPFAGIASADPSSIAVDVPNPDIINGNCPYVRSCTLKVPSWAPDFSMLPLSLQELFRKTFDYTATTALMKSSKRATPAEWCNALAPLGAKEPNPNLKTCTNTNNIHHQYHVYASHNATCPWCKCEGYVSLAPQTKRTLQKQTLKQNKNIPVVQTAGSTSTGQAAASSKTKQMVRRKPYLFYIVLIAFGIASGFIFEGIASEKASEALGSYISPTTCAVVLAIIGAIIGLLLAHHFEDSYIYADNAIPWLLLGGVVIFIPPVVTYIAAIVIGIILSILAVVVGIAIFCACLSGS